jgi:hypothetical protein
MNATITQDAPAASPPVRIRFDKQLLLYQDTACYETGYNLTPDQQRWLAAARLHARVLEGRQVPRYMSLAFRANPRLAHTQPLRRDQVCRIEDLLVMSCSFIPREACRHTSPELYRLNWLEHRVRCQGPDGSGDDGCLYVSSDQDPDPAFQLRQYDLYRPPTSRLEAMHLVRYSVDEVPLPDGARLLAPRGGDFRVRRTTKHLDLCLDEHVVFRFLQRDASCVRRKGVAVPEGRVEAGAVLALLTHNCTYARPGWNVTRRSETAYLPTSAPHAFCGHELEPGGLRALRIAIRQMEQLGLAESDDFEQLPPATNPDEHLPDYLLELDERLLRQLPQQPGWVYTEDLQNDLVTSLRPDADTQFFAAAKCGSDTTYAAHWDEAETGSVVVKYANGVEQRLPQGVSLLHSVLSGTAVRPGEPVAYWLTGGAALWALEWSGIRDLPHLPFLVTEFLRSVAVLPGSRGYTGTKVLVPARYVPEELRSQASGRYLDFVTMAPLYDADLAAFITPPLYQLGWKDLTGEYRGVVYDATPRRLLFNNKR